MLINPTERYLRKKGFEQGYKKGIVVGKLYVALNLLDDGYSMEEVIELAELSEEDILNEK